jgi:predicted transcriptional regulator
MRYISAERRDLVMRAVADNPGAGSVAISAATGLSWYSVQPVLRTLRAEGLLRVTFHGQGTSPRWFAA